MTHRQNPRPTGTQSDAGHNSDRRRFEFATGCTAEIVQVASLVPRPRQTRKHPDKQITNIAASISEFGQPHPIMINAENEIVDGQAVYLALLELGIAECFVVRVEHLSPAQERAFSLAVNKLAEATEWDPDVVRAEFEYFLSAEVDFEVEVTGFPTVEIDNLMEDSAPSDDEADALPEAEVDAVAVTLLGDTWKLGSHRLHCGSALEAAAFDVLFDGELADIVLTDPPFNVVIQGNAVGSGAKKYREFGMASGEMSSNEFTDFLGRAFLQMVTHSRDGSIHYVFMDWRHIKEIIAAGEEAYSELKNMVVWNKSNAGQGSFYRNKHELIFVFKNGDAKHTNNFGLGETGRYRTNVWDYPSLSALGPNRDALLALHPTVKPVALVADALRDCSKRGDIVLDPFCGSGTTIIAAHKTGRVARCIELDPLYVDTAVRRWQEFTGQKAVLVGSDRTFDDIAENGRNRPIPRARNRERRVRHG